MKKGLLIILGGVLLLTLTGCNRQVVDFEYTYDKAICNFDGKVEEFRIRSWRDYEGEQIQFTTNEGQVYLTSSITCTLVRD